MKSQYGTQFPRLYLAMAESVSLSLLSQGVLQKLMALPVSRGKTGWESSLTWVVSSALLEQNIAGRPLHLQEASKSRLPAGHREFRYVLAIASRTWTLYTTVWLPFLLHSKKRCGGNAKECKGQPCSWGMLSGISLWQHAPGYICPHFAFLLHLL